MGGLGSGRFKKPYSKKKLISDFPIKIDMCEMKGKLRSGNVLELVHNTGTSSFSFLILVEDESVIIDLGSIEETKVEIKRTLCNYGGIRAWFICPKCGKQIRILHYDGEYCCRRCCGFVYPSTREKKPSKILERKYYKLARKLIIKDGYIIRPKYMKRKKFERLKKEFLSLDRILTEKLLLDDLRSKLRLINFRRKFQGKKEITTEDILSPEKRANLIKDLEEQKKQSIHQYVI